MGQSRVGGLFGQRKDGLFPNVDVLNEANFHRCYLSEWVGQKAVECCRNENNGNEEVEPPMRFVHERCDWQNDEGTEKSEGSVNYDLESINDRGSCYADIAYRFLRYFRQPEFEATHPITGLQFRRQAVLGWGHRGSFVQPTT